MGKEEKQVSACMNTWVRQIHRFAKGLLFQVGFRLDANNSSCSDIDECANIGKYWQILANIGIYW